mgnify:FL=1
MKLNRKGFMMAEVVVVSAVIVTVLVTLFTGINKVSTAYEKRNKYYDITSSQFAIEANNILEEQGLKLINKQTGDYIGAIEIGYENDGLCNEDKIVKLSDSTNSALLSNFDDLFGKYQDTYTGYFIPYNIDVFAEGKVYEYAGDNNGNSFTEAGDINATFKDYLNYQSTHYDFNLDFRYVIVVERCNAETEKECYYFGLRVR